MDETAKWYVIHTYSGYEKKVETNIRKMIDNRGLQDQIVDIRVPEEDDTESEARKGAKRKVFPSYVFIKMIMSDDAWHSVRNIRGVTGFVGPESKPVPLSEEELNTMKIEVKPVKIEFDTGDVVRIIDGPLNGYLGKVLEIVTDKSKVKLSVDLFMGRETEVDLDISQVESIV
jgi:transcriptional antiterminator NusG